MADMDWSLLILAALVGLVVESYSRRTFPRGIRQGVRGAWVIWRAKATIRKAERLMKDHRDG